MTLAIIKPVWMCGECHTVHDDEEDAVKCCSPEIIEGYACITCSKFYQDDDEADACCNTDQAEADAGVIMATARERELHGQSRLFD